jgi:acetyl esterase/lipase
VASDVRIEASPVGPVLYPPGHDETVVLYLPGNQDDGTDPALDNAIRLAELTRSVVVCCRYRSTFPAAQQDVHAAYRYCQTAGSVVVAGERMGAGLAAALLVQLRDSGTPLPQGAVLVSALLDLTMQAKSLRLHAGGDSGVKITELRRRVADYAGGALLTDPYLSPLYANLHGLTPVRLLVAGTDPLLDDSLAFAARAARSGVAVDLRVWPDASSLDAATAPAVADFIVGLGQAASGRASRMIAG